MLWRDDAAGARGRASSPRWCARVARMGAQWAAAGFVHGVLNTDNINVTGESFDYGPWRWLPAYDPTFTAAYFDSEGLYSFGRQPEALYWNLARLADCLLVLAPQAGLETALEGFGPALQEGFADALFARLGLARGDGPSTDRLVGAFWRFLAESQRPVRADVLRLVRGTRQRRPRGGEPFRRPLCRRRPSRRSARRWRAWRRPRARTSPIPISRATDPAPC